MSEPSVSYYQTVSPIGKPILDILGVQYRSTCIDTINFLEYYQGWNFKLCTALTYLWRLGQKTPHIGDDLKKAIDYLQWALEDNLTVLPINMERPVTEAITACRKLQLSASGMTIIGQENILKSVEIIKLHELAKIPQYAHEGDSGADLCSIERVEIPSGHRAKIRTGLSILMPKGMEAQVRSRSGLAINCGIVVLNSPGTIDSCYTGEICVILINHGDIDYVVNIGDKIAQLVIAPVIHNAIETTESVKETRGVNGFGSSDRRCEISNFYKKL